MKDSVIALIEAVRLARLELHCFRDPRCASSAEWTVKRLEQLLFDPKVGQALQIIASDAESPPLVPEQSKEQELID